MSIEKLRQHYPELWAYNIVPPDIIDDGETLSSLEDGVLDFIIANHMLEHCENPLGTIRNHLSKIRSGGILYYAVPEKAQSFDVGRATTAFQHLIEDDSYGPERSRVGHFHEWVTLVNKVIDPEEAALQIEELIRMNYSIHFHVWDESSFRAFLDDAHNYLGRNFDIDSLTRNGTEIIAILRKH